MRSLRPAGVLVAVSLIVGVAGSAIVAAEGEAAMMAEQHYAKGEVLYGKEWVPIEKLFKDYRKARYELSYAETRGDRTRDQLEGLHRDMALMRSETREAERPVRVVLGKARNELREYNRILRKNPPVRPILREMPTRPRRPSGYTGSGSSRFGGTSSSRNSSSNRYDDLIREWRRRCSEIQAENDRKVKKYQQELKIYSQEQARAKAEIPKLMATIGECDQKLEGIESDLKTKQQPTRSRSDGVTEEALAQNRKISVIETRIKNMATALRAAPEALRFKHGIVEFEDVFYTMAELRATHGKTQAEIDRVSEQLKAESEKDGIPFPEKWRHPQQDRMDAIKAVLEKAEAAYKKQRARRAA